MPQGPQNLITAGRGLATAEARQRLAKFGPNDPSPSCHRSGALDLLLLFLNPLAILLIIAGVVSAFLGELMNATIIITMVVLGVGINFFQTYRSQRAVERLRQQVAPTATVLRDSQWQEIHRHDVVPDDIIRLSAGDLVPADARLLESRDLYVLQATLTGESMPAEKQARHLGDSV
jgi:P-type Mg2+ transporter